MPSTITLFVKDSCIQSGSPGEIGAIARDIILAEGSSGVLLFDDANGCQLEVDLRDGRVHGLDDAETAAPSERRRGRPKLGVTSREVTLLPNQWQWLNQQPGGASAALRRLVNAARNNNKDKVRKSQNAAYAFIQAIAGNLSDYEEVNRALFAGDGEKFRRLVEGWPSGIAEYATQLAVGAFSQ